MDKKANDDLVKDMEAAARRLWSVKRPPRGLRVEVLKTSKSVQLLGSMGET